MGIFINFEVFPTHNIFDFTPKGISLSYNDSEMLSIQITEFQADDEFIDMKYEILSNDKGLVNLLNEDKILLEQLESKASEYFLQLENEILSLTLGE